MRVAFWITPPPPPNQFHGAFQMANYVWGMPWDMGGGRMWEYPNVGMWDEWGGGGSNSWH